MTGSVNAPQARRKLTMKRNSRAPLEPFDRGRAAAEGGHHGDPLKEPSMKAMFDELAAQLAIQYRTDPALSTAQTTLAHAADQTLAAIEDEAQAGRCSKSVKDIAAARRRIAENKQHRAEAQLHRTERETINRLYVAATAGLAPLRNFATGFNSARQLHPNWGSPLDPLLPDHELATELLRLAVRQPDLTR